MTDTYVVGANMKPTILKDPNATLDYIWDWTLWLDDITDTIASHVVTVPVGLTMVSSAVVGKTVVAFISGGTVDTTYAVACKITTANATPRIDERTIYIKVKER